MSDLESDHAGAPELSEQDLAIAALVGRYIERREHHQAPCVHDLLAAAAEFRRHRRRRAADRARHLRGDAPVRRRPRNPVDDAGGLIRARATPTPGRGRACLDRGLRSRPNRRSSAARAGPPLGSAGGSRRAVVGWSDGTTGEALRWYPDEIHRASPGWSAERVGSCGRCISAATAIGSRPGWSRRLAGRRDPEAWHALAGVRWRGIGPPPGRAAEPRGGLTVSTTLPPQTGRTLALEQIHVPENVRTLSQSPWCKWISTPTTSRRWP